MPEELVMQQLRPSRPGRKGNAAKGSVVFGRYPSMLDGVKDFIFFTSHPEISPNCRGELASTLRKCTNTPVATILYRQRAFAIGEQKSHRVDRLRYFQAC
jgi:hypothetical protein